MKIIIDTNVWIKFLISKDFSNIDILIRSGKIKLLFSQELLSEFINVTQRPKFKKYFSANDINEILFSVQSYAEFVEVKSEIHVCRDQKDNFILALAIDGKANLIITGDDDLLSMKKFKKTKIIKIADFLAQLGTTH